MHIIAAARVKDRETERLCGNVREWARVDGGLLPSLTGAQLDKKGRQRFQIWQQVEFRFQIGCAGLENPDLIIKTCANRGEPPPRLGGGGTRRSDRRVVSRAVMTRERGGEAERFANPGKDVLTLAHARVLQYSLNVCDATGGRSRVLVHAYIGSRRVPLTKR